MTSSVTAARPTWFTRARIPAMLSAAFLLFSTGVFFPFFHVSKLWIFESGISVVSGIASLFKGGEYFLFAILSLFTLAFPLAKLSLLTLIWMENDQDLARLRRLHHRVEALGKWSMLDVFVVAILIVVMKAAGLAKIEIGLGLYLFTASVILTQFTSALIHRELLPAKSN